MALIADGLLIAAALAAALYCHVLARRLRRLRDMDGGVGAAIAALSAQVDEMRAALAAARTASGESSRNLAETTARAEMAAGRLELLLAALHDRDGARPLDLGARRAASAEPVPFRAAPRPSAEPGTDSGDVLRAPVATGAPAPKPAEKPAASPAETPPVAEPAPRRSLRRAKAVAPATKAVDEPSSEPVQRTAVAAAGGRRGGETAALRAALAALAREGER